MSSSFKERMYELMLGENYREIPISENEFLARLKEKLDNAVELFRENTELKTKMGVVSVENEQLKMQLSFADNKNPGHDIATRASKALAQMAGAYGDDLTWDNVVERANGALRRLQSVAPLLRMSEQRMAEMKARVEELEGRVPVKKESDDEVIKRLAALEGDLRLFRTLGRMGSKWLGLDALKIKR